MNQYITQKLTTEGANMATMKQKEQADLKAFMAKSEKKIEEVEVTVKYEMPEEPSKLKDVNEHKGKGYMK